MEKLFYFLKKIGMLRSASYSVKGDASKLVEIDAKDGGMIQGQKEIDAEYTTRKGKKLSERNEEPSEKNETKKTKVLFWVFAALALFFLIAFLGDGFSLKSFLVIAIWIAFLISLWQGKGKWTSSFVTVSVIGVVLVFVSLFSVDSSEQDKTNNNHKTVSSEMGKNAGDKQRQFKVKSADGKVSGIAASSEIQKGENKGKILVSYHILLNDKIRENSCQSNMEVRPGCEKEIFDYTYSAMLKDGPKDSKGDLNVTTLIGAYCNKETVPMEDLFKSHQGEYKYTVCHDKDLGWANKTETFYIVTMPTFDNYESFMKINTFTVYNATKNWKPETDGGDASYYLDTLDSVKAENEYRSYQFELEEL